MTFDEASGDISQAPVSFYTMAISRVPQGPFSQIAILKERKKQSNTNPTCTDRQSSSNLNSRVTGSYKARTSSLPNLLVSHSRMRL